MANLQWHLFKLFYFIYIFMTVLGLHCCAGFSLAVASRAYSLAAVYGLLIAVDWLLLLTGSRAHRPQQL